MKDKLDKLMNRAFRKPLYRIAVIVFGLPTFIVAFLGFMINRKKEEAEYGRYRETAKSDAKADGTLERIQDSAKYYLANKYRYFGKQENSAEFQKELDKQIKADTEEEISARVKAAYQKDGKSGQKTFVQYLCGCLENKTWLVLSVITSFPMYILLLIFSNAYSRYIFERLIMMIFVAFGVVFVVFTILHFASSAQR